MSRMDNILNNISKNLSVSNVNIFVKHQFGIFLRWITWIMILKFINIQDIKTRFIYFLFQNNSIINTCRIRLYLL